MWNNFKETFSKILSSKTLWKSLYLLLIGVGILFLSTTLYAIVSYLRFNHVTEAQVEKFEILSSNQGGAQVCVDYSYKVKDVIYKNKECLKNFYMNPFTAREDIEKRLSLKKWKVFYYSSNPQTATIQKHFPVSLTVRTSLIFSIALYFWFFGRYIKKRFS